MGTSIQSCAFFIPNRDTPLSTLMRRLLTGYAVSFSRRHKRHGQLFQNRYKSIICQEDAYLKELVRYIHLNPLRARIVTDISELNNYTYCGHKVLLKKEKHPWQDSGCVLSYFGKSLREPQKGYLQYIEAGIEQKRRPELVGGGLIRNLGGWQVVKDARFSGQGRMKGDHRILGDSAFVIGVGSGRREIWTFLWAKKQRIWSWYNRAEGLRDFWYRTGRNIFKEPPKNQSGSKGVILLLGGREVGIFIGRFGKTFWYDCSRDRVCCEKGWANRQRTKL